MPKNIDDIIPREKRSIRDIPIPNGRRRTDSRTPLVSPIERPTRVKRTDDIIAPESRIHIKKEINREQIEEEIELPRVKAASFRRDSGRRSGKTKWIAAFLVAVVVAFAILSFFQSSTLTYVPRTASVTFNDDEVSASKTSVSGTLLFSVVKLSDDQSEPITASGPAVPISKKASGTITVFNTNASAQPLVATTRFQSSDGHIYRTPSAVTIPGKSASGPGSTSITIVADQPGSDYNIGLDDFTIPGFKGTAKFASIYARSKTAMSGGIVGTEKQISDSVRSDAKTDLQNKLKTNLLDQAKAEVPADFILFPDLAVVNYTDLSDSSTTDASVTLNEHGDFYGVMFKRSDLAAFIGTDKLSLPSGQTIEVPDLTMLKIAFTNSPPSDLLNTDTINLTLNGTTTAVWLTDEAALKNDLVGKSKSDLASILKNYPGILSASATVRPFWKSTFPTDAAKITIKENPSK